MLLLYTVMVNSSVKRADTVPAATGSGSGSELVFHDISMCIDMNVVNI